MKVVSGRLIQTPIMCTKTSIRKHPVLNKEPENIQDLYDIAKDRAAFSALALSLMIEAHREKHKIDFANPPEIDL